MTFQVDLSTKAARTEVKLLNSEIGHITQNLRTASGAAGRLSKQARNMGGGQIKTLTSSIVDLNMQIKRMATNWTRTQTVAAGATKKQTADVKHLTTATKKLSTSHQTGKRRSDELGHAFHTTSQKAAAFRASMLGLNTHMGMFTARTLVAATTAYAFVRAIRSTISVGAEYEKSMQRVYAISGSLGEVAGQVTPEMKMLDDAVRAVGKTTIFTASQVAEGAVQFAMAGFSAVETASALSATASLAAIGMTDMGTAARTSANILNSFSMESSQLEEVVDRMAVAVTGSMMDIKQLGTALSFVGPLAKETNTSFRDTVIILELMHDAGIKASKAGTAVRRGMVNMLNPTAKQLKVLTELNIATKDSEGGMRSMLAISKDLAAKGIKPAGIATLFGARAVAAWTQVINEAKKQIEGTNSKLTEFEAAQDKAKGQAEKLRKELEQNLISQFTLFKSAIQDVQQDLYNKLVPALTSAVQWLTEFTKSINVDNITLFIQLIGASAAAFGVWKVAAGFATAKALLLASATINVATGMRTATTAAIVFKTALTALMAHPILLALAGITAAWFLLRDATNATGEATVKVTNQMDESGAKAIKNANKNAKKLKDVMDFYRVKELRDAKQHKIDLLESIFKGNKERLKEYQHLYDEVTKLDAKMAIAKTKVDQYKPEVGKGKAKAKGLDYALAFTQGIREASPVDVFKLLAKDLTKKKTADPFEVSAESSIDILRMDQEFYEKREKLDDAYAVIKRQKMAELAMYEGWLALNVSEGGEKIWGDKIAATVKSLDTIEQVHKNSNDKLLNQRESALVKQQALEDKFNDARTKALYDFQAMEDINKDFGISLAKGFEDAIIEGGKFSDVLKQIEKDIARMIIRKNLTGGMAGAASDMFGSMLSGMGFASGGRPPLNQVSVVGEQGPELFVPDTAGTIVPNHQLSSGGGGGGVTINQTVSVDARGSTVGAAELSQAAEAGAKRGYNAVAHDFMTNGPLRRAITS